MSGLNLDCYEINSDMPKLLTGLSIILIDRSMRRADRAGQNSLETYGQRLNNLPALSAKAQPSANKAAMYQMKTGN